MLNQGGRKKIKLSEDDWLNMWEEVYHLKFIPVEGIHLEKPTAFFDKIKNHIDKDMDILQLHSFYSFPVQHEQPLCFCQVNK